MSLKPNENYLGRLRGHVVMVDQVRGFGFIMPSDQSIVGDAYFADADVTTPGNLNVNDRVTFRLSKTERGHRARLIERDV